jgi:outer membrane receptor protein involved in Fe transport
MNLHLRYLGTALAIASPTLAAAVDKADVKAVSNAAPAAARDKSQAEVYKVEIHGASDYDPRRDDTASKSVISSAEILKYGDTNVYDVLKRAPGVTVVGKSIRMRGLGSGYTQILVNGERPAPGFSLDLVAPEQIERIEVVRAASAEFSMQAIAGTINVVLKKTVSKPQRDLRVNMSHSNENEGVVVLGTLAERTGNLSYYVSGTVAHNFVRSNSYIVNQFVDPDGELLQYRDGATVGDKHSTSLSIQPRLSWKLPNDDQINWNASLQASRSDGEYQMDYDNLIGSFGSPEYMSYLTGNASRAVDLSTDLNWITKLAGGKLDVKVSVWKSKVDSDVRVLSSTADRRISSDRDADSTSHFLTRSSTGKYTRTLFDGHALGAGWEANVQETEEERLRVEGLVGAVPSRIADSFRPEVTRLAAFVQDEWSVTKQWSIYQGVCYETIRTESEGSGIAGTRSRSHVLSPVLQTLYKFPDKSGRQLRLALTRTYKAPGTNQLTARRIEAEINTRFNADSSGNPDLQPELATGVDLTYEHFWAPGAMFSLGTSARQISDYIRNVLTQDDDGRWLFQPINDGDASVYTVDAEIKFPLKTVWKAGAGFDVRASVNRNWSKVDTVPGPHNRLDQQIPLTATAGLDYKGDKFSAGASLAFHSGGPVRISEQQSTHLQTRRDLDAYVLYRIKPGLQLRSSVTNLLGEENREVYRYQGMNGTDQTWVRRPNSRRFQVNVEIKL